MINTQSFIWHDVEQWPNLKCNAVKMKKGIKSPYMTFSRKNAFSRAIIVIHISSYYSRICRKEVKINFVWLFLKHHVRKIVTPIMATLMVSWAQTICACFVLSFFIADRQWFNIFNFFAVCHCATIRLFSDRMKLMSDRWWHSHYKMHSKIVCVCIWFMHHILVNPTPILSQFLM